MNRPLKIAINLFLIISFLFSTSIVLTGCSNTSEVDKEIIEQEEEKEVGDICSTGKLFIEKDGMVRVDIENPSFTANGWTTANTLAGFEGSGYLVWIGNDNFNTPGIGFIKCSIKITNPGTYQFVWRSRIAQGTSNTDFNDSWLRIPTASDFYAEKAGGEKVYPKGSGKTPVPEGAGSNGWFKVYMNRVGEWFWRSSTSDNDPHNIFAKFDAPGTYDIEISGRSKFHAIDQFVLFKTDKTLPAAQNAALSEITWK